MARIARRSKKPVEFNLERYEHCADWHIGKWKMAVQLVAIPLSQTFDVPKEFHIDCEYAAEYLEMFWASKFDFVFDVDAPLNILTSKSVSLLASYWDTQPKFSCKADSPWFEHDVEDEPHPFEELSPSLVFLEMNISATDEAISDALRVLLRRLRGAHTPSIRAEASLNLKRKWHEERLLPYLHLMAWSHARGVKFKDVDFVDWLFPGDGGGTERFRKTTKKNARVLLHHLTSGYG
jgi:Family of unknown function (DUF6387)